MEIRVLRYFLGVVREGSITAGAKVLHVTQPTLSRQLLDLEEELGQKLFIRSNHSITLTAEGMLFRKRAEEIMAMVRKTESEFSSLGNIVAGDVYIGGGETEAMKQIAELIRELHDDYPEIRFHLFSGNSEDVTERLDKGLLDFGILIQPVDIAKYDALDLPNPDVWGVIMRRDSPLADKDAITRADLLKLPLICSRQAIQETVGRNEYQEWFGKDFAKLDIVATYNLIFNAAHLVESGLGYAITLDKLIDTRNTGDLCFRPLSPRLESRLNIVWKKYQVFSPAAKLFLERMRDKFEK